MTDGVHHAFVVDAHPVDEGSVLREAEKPRLGIALLWFGCKGTDLYEGEAEQSKFVVMLPIFVYSGCKSYGIWEIKAENSA